MPILRVVVPVIPAGTGAADGNLTCMASLEGCAQCVVSGLDLRCGRVTVPRCWPVLMARGVLADPATVGAVQDCGQECMRLGT